METDLQYPCFRHGTNDILQHERQGSSGCIRCSTEQHRPRRVRCVAHRTGIVHKSGEPNVSCSSPDKNTQHKKYISSLVNLREETFLVRVCFVPYALSSHNAERLKKWNIHFPNDIIGENTWVQTACFTVRTDQC